MRSSGPLSVSIRSINGGEYSMCGAFDEYYEHATTVFNEVVGLPRSYVKLLLKLAGSRVLNGLDDEIIKELNAITLESIT